MNHVISALDDMGIKVQKPRGTFYVWAEVPEGFTSMGFSEELMEKTGVIVTPGNVFGTSGEGYFRISLSHPKDRLLEAVRRMNELLMEV